MRQPTVEEINAHMKTGLKRVVLHVSHTLKLRLLEARTYQGKKQGRVMGWRCFREEDQWVEIKPDTRVDLL